MSDYRYDAKLREVHDGDTVTLDVDLGFEISQRMHIRLYGINAPEINTPEGRASKTHLEYLLVGHDGLVLESIKDRADKYGGRYLGIIKIVPPVSPVGGPQGDKNVNMQMVEDGFAKNWDGKGVKPV